MQFSVATHGRFLAAFLAAVFSPCLLFEIADAREPHKLRFADPLQPWQIATYPELNRRGVQCVVEDRRGRMWFGLAEGVTCYDGHTWRDFGAREGLPKGPVYSMALDQRDGSLLAVTTHALYRQYGARWQREFPQASERSFPLTRIQYQAGELWGCSPLGLIRWGEDATTIYTSTLFSAVCEALAPSAEISILPDSVLPKTPFLEGCGIALGGDYVAGFDDGSPARDAGMAVGDRLAHRHASRDAPARASEALDANALLGLSIVRLDGRADTVSFRPLDQQENASRYPSPRVHRVTIDSQGRWWLGVSAGTDALQGRVVMSADKGRTWRTWTPKEVKIGKLPAIMESRDGTIHAVSANNYSSFDGKNWTSQRLSMLTGTRYDSAIAQASDDSVWVSGLNRLHVCRDGRWQSYDTRVKQVPNDSHRFFAASDGALWIVGPNQFAVRLDISTTGTFSLDGADYQCTDADGCNWFIDTTTHRVVCCEGWEAGTSYGLEDEMIDTPCGIIAGSPGEVVVFGSHDGVAALATLRGGQWTRLKFPRLARCFSSKAATVSRDGRFWIAARGNRNEDQLGGAVVGSKNVWEHLTPPSAPKYSTGLVQMPNGDMAFSGGHGVWFLRNGKWIRPTDPQLLHPIASATANSRGAWFATRIHGVLSFTEGQWRTLSIEQGLPAEDVARVTTDLHGQLWASTSAGLCRYDGRQFYLTPLPEALGRQFMSADPAGGVWFNGRHRYLPDTNVPVVKVHSADSEMAEGNAATFEWSGVDRWNRTASADLLWSYRIDDGPWSTFKAIQHTTVRDLPAGVHQFQVRVRDTDMNTSQPSAASTLVVHPAIWKRLWFLGLAALLAIVIGWQGAGLLRRGLSLRHTNQELELARRRLAEQVAETSAQFRAVCDCSPVGIFVTDLQGDVTYFNHTLTHMVDLTTEEVKGSGWAKMVHPEDRTRVTQVWQDSVARGGGYECSGRFLREDGVVIWFEAVANPFYVNGEPVGYVGAVDDVTQRVVAENELRHSNEQLRDAMEQLRHAQLNAIKRERLSALGQMAAGVAHDVNNSLAPLLTYADLLANEPSIQGDQREWVDLIRLGVNDTAATVRRLEHFYRESHNPELLEAIELAPLIEQVVDLTRPHWSHAARTRGKLIRINVQLEDQPVIAGNPSQLRSVLTNLLFNAVDAIESTGTVTFRLSELDNRAVLEVVDDGKGMSEGDLSRCLEPFYTSKEHGSGLGLSECHGVVRQHGGTIHLSSSLNRGTTVHIEMPLADCVEEPAAMISTTVDALPPPTTSGQSVAKLLLIEDDDSVRASTHVLLESLGFEVRSVGDGPSGLGALESGEFHLVVCDQGLPGMSGLAVLQQIKSELPDLPVVLVSGWSLPDIQDGVQPDAFLEKPFRLDDLRDKLNQFVPMAVRGD